MYNQDIIDICRMRLAKAEDCLKKLRKILLLKIMILQPIGHTMQFFMQ